MVDAGVRMYNQNDARPSDLAAIAELGHRAAEVVESIVVDLTRFGIVDGDTLTCQLHGWKFDLPSGRCLTSAGHPIRASRKTDSVAASAERS